MPAEVKQAHQFLFIGCRRHSSRIYSIASVSAKQIHRQFYGIDRAHSIVMESHSSSLLSLCCAWVDKRYGVILRRIAAPQMNPPRVIRTHNELQGQIGHIFSAHCHPVPEGDCDVIWQVNFRTYLLSLCCPFLEYSRSDRMYREMQWLKSRLGVNIYKIIHKEQLNSELKSEKW